MSRVWAELAEEKENMVRVARLHAVPQALPPALAEAQALLAELRGAARKKVALEVLEVMRGRSWTLVRSRPLGFAPAPDSDDVGLVTQGRVLRLDDMLELCARHWSDIFVYLVHESRKIAPADESDVEVHASELAAMRPEHVRDAGNGNKKKKRSRSDEDECSLSRAAPVRGDGPERPMGLVAGSAVVEFQAVPRRGATLASSSSVSQQKKPRRLRGSDGATEPPTEETVQEPPAKVPPPSLSQSAAAKKADSTSAVGAGGTDKDDDDDDDKAAVAAQLPPLSKSTPGSNDKASTELFHQTLAETAHQVKEVQQLLQRLQAQLQAHAHAVQEQFHALVQELNDLKDTKTKKQIAATARDEAALGPAPVVTSTGTSTGQEERKRIREAISEESDAETESDVANEARPPRRPNLDGHQGLIPVDVLHSLLDERLGPSYSNNSSSWSRRAEPQQPPRMAESHSGVKHNGTRR
jgi:hypothetical protein